MYCLNMLRIALELSLERPVYQDTASKFLEHFLRLADAVTDIGGAGRARSGIKLLRLNALPPPGGPPRGARGNWFNDPADLTENRSALSAGESR